MPGTRSHSATWSVVVKLRVSSMRARCSPAEGLNGLRCVEVAGGGVGAVQGGVGEVDVEHDLSCGHPGSCLVIAGVVGGVAGVAGEVEGGLGAGEDAEGLGAAYVEGLVGAGQGEVAGLAGHGVVEVEGVGEVEAADHVDGALDALRATGGGVEVDVEAAVLGGLGAVVLGGLGVEAAQGFLDEAGQGGVGAGGGDPGEVPVDPFGGLGGQGEGGLGDPSGPPHRHPGGGDGGVEAGEAVAGLHDVGDVAHRGVGGQADRGAVLDDGELRDRWGARPGDADLQVGAGQDRGAGRVVGGVHGRPGAGGLVHRDLGGVAGRALGAGVGEHRVGGVAALELLRGHAPSLLEQAFESRVCRWRWKAVTRRRGRGERSPASARAPGSD